MRVLMLVCDGGFCGAFSQLQPRENHSPKIRKIATTVIRSQSENEIAVTPPLTRRTSVASDLSLESSDEELDDNLWDERAENQIAVTQPRIRRTSDLRSKMVVTDSIAQKTLAKQLSSLKDCCIIL